MNEGGGTIAAGSTMSLRVLIADGAVETLEEVTETVRSLGHEVVGAGTDTETVGHVTAVELPDIALVLVGTDPKQALQVIRAIVAEAACPVIAILPAQDRMFVDEAARLGIFSYITRWKDQEEMQSAIDVALQRFAEYHALEGAFGRRAVTERAKGILMERHGVDEHQAFLLLRDRARATNTKIVHVAESVLASHHLLPSGREPLPPGEAFSRGEADA